MRDDVMMARDLLGTAPSVSTSIGNESNDRMEDNTSRRHKERNESNCNLIRFRIYLRHTRR